MGYDNPEVFFGKHHDGQNVIAGFRFVVPLAQGTTLTSGSLSLYLEEKYPEGIGVLDHFTDTNGVLLTAHTPDVGPASGWLHYSGNMIISSNRAVNAGVYACESAVADGVVKVIATLNTGGPRSAGIVFRLSDEDNYWTFYRYKEPYGYDWFRIFLVKVVDGSSTTVGNINLGSGDPAGPSLKVVLDGNSIKCYQGGILRFNETSSDLASNTEHGLYGVNSGQQLDNFEFIPAGTSGSISFGVSCEDVNNSADFQTGGLPNTRTLTTGYRSLGDISGWNKDDWNTTVDIKIPIQEVLDRPGWVSGNHLSVIVIPSIVEGDCLDGERFRVESYDGNPNRAAKLALSW